MMFSLLDYIKIGTGAALGVMIAILPSYYYGKHEGCRQAAVAALAASVKAVNARSDIDAQISSADAARLCGDFGLSDGDKAECMRRLGEADAKP
jgi:hypothetical protein